MILNVHLDRFEGPLALLLHLIRQEEMDIFDININQITHQYLEYIKAMKKLDLEMAGDFVAMAATLIHIKSKMLLPQYDPETGEPLEEDPRKELVQKLVEYQKFQQLSKELYQRPILGRDVFTRGYRTDIESTEEGELILEEKPLFSMIKAYRFAMKNMKKTIHRVIGELQSIAARILEMKDQLVVGVRVPFTVLLESSAHKHNNVLVTFLSLLELAKMGLVSLFQADPMTEIHVEAKKTIDRDVISQAEDYENTNAEGRADALFAEAAAVQQEFEGNQAGTVSLDEGVMDYEQQELSIDPAFLRSSDQIIEAASDEEILAAERELNFVGIEETHEPLQSVEVKTEADDAYANYEQHEAKEIEATQAMNELNFVGEEPVEQTEQIEPIEQTVSEEQAINAEQVNGEEKEQEV